MKFHKVIVIYNPNSTGDSESNARDFAANFKRLNDKVDIEVIPTKYAGHAEELAMKHGVESGVLIVSSSGDGGYNEVVNGALAAGGASVIAVLPAGNANDHHRAIAPDDLIKAASKGTVKKIETIRIRTTINKTPWERHAHSYIGFGVTPKIGKVLTEVRPNVITEKWHVLKHLFSHKAVRLHYDGATRQYNSLIVATIDRMSKVIKLDQNARSNDGLMELYENEHVPITDLLKQLAGISINGLERSQRVRRLSLRTTRAVLVQLDGEVFRIDANADVELECIKSSITTLA